MTFEQAQQAFFDPHRVMLGGRIRIFGAGYWRVGKRLYCGEES